MRRSRGKESWLKFHGLRHTCATLLLQAGTPVHVVSERLGHSKVSMPMEVSAHVLPDVERDAPQPWARYCMARLGTRSGPRRLAVFAVWWSG